jgi:hypothetical protein
MGGQVRLTIVPVDLDYANDYVARLHRHHQPVVGHKFSIGVVGQDGECHGVAIIGRPVARHRDDGFTLEVTRCCTDGTPNAPSALYGAAAKTAFAMGYRRIGTYMLKTEPGTSLKAAGWKCIGERGGRSWSTPSRPRLDKHPLQTRLLWEAK